MGKYGEFVVGILLSATDKLVNSTATVRVHIFVLVHLLLMHASFSHLLQLRVSLHCISRPHTNEQLPSYGAVRTLPCVRTVLTLTIPRRQLRRTAPPHRNWTKSSSKHTSCTRRQTTSSSAALETVPSVSARHTAPQPTSTPRISSPPPRAPTFTLCVSLRI